MVGFFPMVPKSFVNHTEQNWINVFKNGIKHPEFIAFVNFDSYSSSISILIKAVYRIRIYHNISVIQCCIWSLYPVWWFCTAHITAGLVRIQSKREIIWLSPSPFRAMMFPPVQSWKHWPPGYSAFLGSDCRAFTRNSLLVVWSIEFTQRGLCLPGH